jgi:hypothetical protein
MQILRSMWSIWNGRVPVVEKVMIALEVADVPPVVTPDNQR